MSDWVRTDEFPNPPNPGDVLYGVDGCPENGSLCFREDGSTVGACNNFCGENCRQALEFLIESYHTAEKNLFLAIAGGQYSEMLCMSKRPFITGVAFVHLAKGAGPFQAVWPPAPYPNGPYPEDRHPKYGTFGPEVMYNVDFSDAMRISLVAEKICSMRTALKGDEYIRIRIGFQARADQFDFFDSSRSRVEVSGEIMSSAYSNTLVTQVATQIGINLFTGHVGWGVDYPVTRDVISMFKTFRLYAEGVTPLAAENVNDTYH